jgi:hypothetical protein
MANPSPFARISHVLSFDPTLSLVQFASFPTNGTKTALVAETMEGGVF